MKANVRNKTLESLTAAERKHLEDLCQQTVDHEEAELQKVWLKMMCAVLHRTCGFGESRCLRVLFGWRKVYWQNKRCKDKAAQTAWLDQELKFFRDGYPEEYVERMEE